MEEYLNLISVPAIAAVVYWVINITKHIVGENETFNRFIPLIATGLGVVCGVICFFFIPSIIPAENVLVAIVIGGASGLTATGANQIIKQIRSGIRIAAVRVTRTKRNSKWQSHSWGKPRGWLFLFAFF